MMTRRQARAAAAASPAITRTNHGAPVPLPQIIDPLRILDAFDFNGWRVEVRQQVTGGLFWLAKPLHRNCAVSYDGRVVRWPEELRVLLPVGFNVHDAKLDAQRALGMESET
jgi:hypothetical protein